MRLRTALNDLERHALAHALHTGDSSLLEAAEALSTFHLVADVLGMLATDD